MVHLLTWPSRHTLLDKRTSLVLAATTLEHLLGSCAVSTPYRDGALRHAWPARSDALIAVTEAVLASDRSARVDV